MWHIANHAPVFCTGCNHLIPRGQPCLSDAPEELPPNANRRQFRHFHFACQECASGGVCYRTFASVQPTHIAEADGACGYCGEAVWRNARFASDYSLLWRGADGAASEPSPASILIFSRLAERLTPFEQLSRPTQLKFTKAGLGRKWGTWTPAEAAELYKRSVPWAVRAQGEDAVLEFLKGKQASHIKSKAAHPDLAKAIKNIVWWNERKNWSQGAKDMSKRDLSLVRLKEAMSAGGLAARAALRTAFWEAPVSAAENSIRVVRGGLPKGQAVKNVAEDTSRAAVSGSAVAIGVMALRIGFLANPAVGFVGTGLFAVSTAQRLVRAWRESPLTPLYLHFHPDCYQRYAAEVSAAASAGG